MLMVYSSHGCSNHLGSHLTSACFVVVVAFVLDMTARSHFRSCMHRPGWQGKPGGSPAQGRCHQRHAGQCDVLLFAHVVAWQEEDHHPATKNVRSKEISDATYGAVSSAVSSLGWSIINCPLVGGSGSSGSGGPSAIGASELQGLPEVCHTFSIVLV